MKTKLLIIIYIFSLSIYSQKIDTLFVTVDKRYDFSKERIERYNKAENLFIQKIVKQNKEIEDLTPEEQSLLENYDEMQDIWSPISEGCSWYCGANYQVKASSALPDTKKNTYKAENVSDLNYKTAWVEGVKGYGIGEYVEFTFPKSHPRITRIIFANGYIKSYNTWINNARVKTLKMYIDNVPYAIIELEDIYAEQYIEVPPIGKSPDEINYGIDSERKWTMKFEILEVFKGNKYEDTAITEIYFDGLDVHCLAKGTKILMANNNVLNIETIKKGDKIKSYNTIQNKFETAIIKDIQEIKHKELIKITFDNQKTIICTNEHPFLSNQNLWFSFMPQKTKNEYKINKVYKLKNGTILKTIKGNIKIINIEKIEEDTLTYNIILDNNKQTYIANDLITKSGNQIR